MTKLQEAMQKNGITNKMIADLLGVHRNTVSNKVFGKKEFNWSEVKLIHDTFFPEYSIRDLFE